MYLALLALIGVRLEMGNLYWALLWVTTAMKMIDIIIAIKKGDN